MYESVLCIASFGLCHRKQIVYYQSILSKIDVLNALSNPSSVPRRANQFSVKPCLRGLQSVQCKAMPSGTSTLTSC